MALVATRPARRRVEACLLAPAWQIRAHRRAPRCSWHGEYLESIRSRTTEKGLPRRRFRTDRRRYRSHESTTALGIGYGKMIPTVFASDPTTAAPREKNDGYKGQSAAIQLNGLRTIRRGRGSHYVPFQPWLREFNTSPRPYKAIRSAISSRTLPRPFEICASQLAPMQSCKVSQIRKVPIGCVVAARGDHGVQHSCIFSEPDGPIPLVQSRKGAWRLSGAGEKFLRITISIDAQREGGFDKRPVVCGDGEPTQLGCAA